MFSLVASFMRFARLLLLGAGILFFAGSLYAAYTPLKGANGRIVEFKIESIKVEGIWAMPRGGYKALLLTWEQLDQDWLKAEQSAIWMKKEQIEAMASVAYEDFKFGDSRARIYQMVNLKNGFSLPNEAFGEGEAEALWITFDPQNLREFFRFQFDAEDRLVALQVHRNFSGEQAIEGELSMEWQRLIELVPTYEVELIHSARLLNSREWQTLVKKTDLAKGLSRVTHQWQDDRREFELALAARKVDIGVKQAKEGKITFFGKEMIITDTAELNTNWVVLTAKLR